MPNYFLTVSNDYASKRNKIIALTSMGYFLLLVTFYIFPDPVSIGF